MSEISHLSDSELKTILVAIEQGRIRRQRVGGLFRFVDAETGRRVDAVRMVIRQRYAEAPRRQPETPHPP